MLLNYMLFIYFIGILFGVGSWGVCCDLMMKDLGFFIYLFLFFTGGLRFVCFNGFLFALSMTLMELIIIIVVVIIIMKSHFLSEKWIDLILGK